MKYPAGGATFLLYEEETRRPGFRNLLNETLTVVYPDSQILVLLQDVDDLVLQRQILLHLRTRDTEEEEEMKNEEENHNSALIYRSLNLYKISGRVN